MAEKDRGKKSADQDADKKARDRKERDARDDKEQDLLGDWNKLNQNPPSVGPMKKKEDKSGKAREK